MRQLTEITSGGPTYGSISPYSWTGDHDSSPFKPAYMAESSNFTLRLRTAFSRPREAYSSTAHKILML